MRKFTDRVLKTYRISLQYTSPTGAGFAHHVALVPGSLSQTLATLTAPFALKLRVVRSRDYG